MDILITSFLAFISTNIDDIFILILFFANSAFRERDIVAGQFIGIIVLIAISLTASLAGFFIDRSYIGLLGLFPVYLGIMGLIDLVKKKEQNETLDKIMKNKNRGSIITVSGFTIANGGDNIGVYAPLSTAMSLTGKFIMITVFLILTGILCIIAKYLTKHPLAAKLIDKYGHIISPFILMLLGILILYKNETIKLLIK